MKSCGGMSIAHDWILRGKEPHCWKWDFLQSTQWRMGVFTTSRTGCEDHGTDKSRLRNPCHKELPHTKTSAPTRGEAEPVSSPQPDLPPSPARLTAETAGPEVHVVEVYFFQDHRDIQSSAFPERTSLQLSPREWPQRSQQKERRGSSLHVGLCSCLW